MRTLSVDEAQVHLPTVLERVHQTERVMASIAAFRRNQTAFGADPAPLRNIRHLNEPPKPGEFRSLDTAILVPEVKMALHDFLKCAAGEQVVVIGALAMGCHTRPRTTLDADIVLGGAISDKSIAALSSLFRKESSHSYRHETTGIEMDVFTPELVNWSTGMAQSVFGTAHRDAVEGVPVNVISSQGLIATKLLRGSPQDLADVYAVLEGQGVLDLSAFPLGPQQRSAYSKLVEELMK